MHADVALIGGTGIGDVLAQEHGQALCVLTKFGPLRGRIIGQAGIRLLLLQRHSAGHKVPPHEVDYRAAAQGLKQLGIPFCFASAAVGSLRTDWPAGTLVACQDFTDPSARNLTLFSDSVQHTDFSQPFSRAVNDALAEAAKQTGHAVQPGGVYINSNGPRYETPHEIELLRHVGNIVGMTAGSEAIVMREAGVEYGCLAVVSNLAAGLGDAPLSHADVVAEMKVAGGKALEVLLEAAQILAGAKS
jgi:5'-methylthioadenosine phosphorylase